VGAEAMLALAVGAVWFVLSSTALAVLPHALVVAAALVVVDVAVVLGVAKYLGIACAVTAGMASVVSLDWYFIPPIHSGLTPSPENAVALAAYLVTGVLLGELAVTARRRADVSEDARSELAGEQAALRRVATLVAHETSPAEVFAAVAEEVGQLLMVDMSTLMRYETDGTATVVAAWSRTTGYLGVGDRLRLDGENVAAAVLRTRRPARIDDFAACSGPIADLMNRLGVRSAAGTPITVDNRLWGVMVGASLSAEPIPPGTEARLGEFTELAATAIANAETRSELMASRARIVATGDDTRRHLERNLHDGVQQRLVSLVLDLRVAEKLALEGPEALAPQLAHVREGLVSSLDDLREISQGIHPAILSEGGLRPALSALARRSPVPVELLVNGVERLPEQVEVGVYYVVSEAVANVIKHAQASVVTVDLAQEDGVVRLHVRDDGLGGADPGQGSGLVGLCDRVHALGGRIDITSPTGSGTSIIASLPA
jgi:signal transduction histidine kinase